jgi:hypothetical protein
MSARRFFVAFLLFGSDEGLMPRKNFGPRFFALLFATLSVAVAAFANGGKVEATGAFSDPAASEAVKKTLEQKGSRVAAADGTVVCEIWLREGVTQGTKLDAPGAVYAGLGQSAMVGVITFPKAATDFRGQAIKPGSYTLRYALHPTDGNHMGISPIRDFLVLVPLSADQNPAAQYSFEELMKMSAKASGTNHPAPLSLVAAEGKGNAATVTENEHGHLVFASRLKMQAGGEQPIAFVVKGIAEQ